MCLSRFLADIPHFLLLRFHSVVQLLRHLVLTGGEQVGIPEGDIDTFMMIRIANVDGMICIRAAIFDGGIHAADLEQRLQSWEKQAALLKAGDITKEEYDRWRYRYPEFDDSSIRVHIPQEVPTKAKRGRKPQKKD